MLKDYKALIEACPRAKMLHLKADISLSEVARGSQSRRADIIKSFALKFFVQRMVLLESPSRNKTLGREGCDVYQA